MSGVDNSNNDQAEIRLMGLILTQAVSIGLAIAIFDSGIWLNLPEPTLNGVTYAMAAFAVQGLAYYLFKMFFQQGMDERARAAAQERARRTRYRSMEMNFDQRRQDMEMRMQEAQLEAELRWMEKNPGRTPPWIESRMASASSSSVDFIPEEVARHVAPMSLGLEFTDAEEDVGPERGPDGKFKKKE
jgi:hypothetical protein